MRRETRIYSMGIAFDTLCRLYTPSTVMPSMLQLWCSEPFVGAASLMLPLATHCAAISSVHVHTAKVFKC